MEDVLECEPALSSTSLAASSGEDALRMLAGQAFAAGFVKESFVEALLARERSYPTGLPTTIPVAIPHAEPEHVIRSGIGLALLDAPLPFREMGSEHDVVGARAIALLLVPDGGSHVDTLQALTKIFRTADWYERLAAARDPGELAATMNAMLRQ